VRPSLKYVVVLIIALNIIYVLTPITALGNGNAQEQYKVFVTKYYPNVKPLGVFKNYIIGIEETDTLNSLVAVDLYSNGKYILSFAESLGLIPSAARFWKTDKYFMITDGKLVVVWDENLRQVGRFAQDDLKGATILLNGDLVVWTKDVVSVAKAPGYVYVKQYDVWSALYKFFKNEKIPPRQLLVMRGVDVVKIEKELTDEFYETVRSANGVVISFGIFYKYDLSATTPTEAKKKLLTDIMAATLSKGIVSAGVNVDVVVNITADGLYEVREGDTTKQVRYLKIVPVVASIGTQVSVPNEDNASVADIYSRIEAGAAASVLAYVYEPVLTKKTYERCMFLLFENGTVLDTPIFTTSTVKEVYLVGNYEVVHTDTGTTLIYEADKLVTALVALELNDVGLTADGRVYIVYTNSMGATEVGLIGRYSGRYDKFILEIKERAVGAHVADPLLFLVAEADGGTLAYAATSEPLTTVSVNFVDIYGNRILNMLSGKYSIEYRKVKYTEVFNYNPLVLRLPVGTNLSVDVEIPYGRASYSYYITEPKAYAFDAVVTTIFKSAMTGLSTTSKPFFNPFFKEFVMIRDTETLKYVLPGARSIDSYGSVLAMIEATNEVGVSTVSVYRVDGVKIYSVKLPGDLTDVKIYYPYMVLRGFDRIYAVDLMSGVIKAEVDVEVLGYDIDIRQEYLAAWTQNTLTVVDLRRQLTTYIDMTAYGTVLHASVVNGVVYAYVASENRPSNVYVINPVSGGVKDVLPWGGRKVLSYATDGVFHAITYEMLNGDVVTDVLSHENGLLRIEKSGSVLWVRSLGKVVDVPGSSELRGNEFAALATQEGKTVNVYVVGMNHMLVSKIYGVDAKSDVRFSLSFLGVVDRNINASAVVLLKDYSGVSRVAIITSAEPALFTVSENLIAYGNAGVVFLIPNPKVMGKYQIELNIYDDRMTPMEAALHIKEFNVDVKAEGGVFKTYLSTPGTFHIVVSAPHYKAKELVISVNDANPVAIQRVVIEPQLYTLKVNVLTPEGVAVREGSLTVKGVDVQYMKKVNLASEAPVFQVRRGTYDVEFTSAEYTSAKAQIVVDSNTEITLQTNKTHIRLNVRVVDEVGTPLSKVSITIETKDVAPIKLETDDLGTAFTLIPYGVTFNLTASKPGYETFRRSFNATATLEGSPLRIVIRKIRGLLTIVLQDEEGKPEAGTVVVKDAFGNIVQSMQVSQSTMLELDLGAYSVEGITADGRTATTGVLLTEEMPQSIATLIFPTKPAPLYIQIFPYLLIAVAVASVGVIVYRRFFRKAGPKKVR